METVPYEHQFLGSILMTSELFRPAETATAGHSREDDRDSRIGLCEGAPLSADQTYDVAAEASVAVSSEIKPLSPQY